MDGRLPDQNDFYDRDDINRTESSGGVSLSGTYGSVRDHIDALNSNGVWINYGSAENTASITSIADFVKACKNASKSVGAFDDLNAAQGENTLFGILQFAQIFISTSIFSPPTKLYTAAKFFSSGFR